jgi:HEAT repeat protein
MTQSPEPAREPRVGVFTTDTDLVVKSWDESLAQMTGISPAQARGQRLEALVPDLTSRVSAERLREPLVSGAVEVLAPAFHKYLIPCPPLEPSAEFDRMQQRVVVGPLRGDEGTEGLIVTVEDVTSRLDRERQLSRLLRDGSAADRVAAVRKLAELDTPDGLGPIETALSDEDWQVRRTAVRALATQRHAHLVDAVVTALRDGHRNFSLLSSALQLLSTTGVDVTEALAGLIKHADADVRIQAALALGSQPRDRAIQPLIDALDDPDVNVRFHAIEAIGHHAHPDGMNRLCDIATSGDFFLAFPAIEALVRINDPIVAPRFAALLSDEMLSGAAADALGQIGDEDAVDPLVKALDNAAVPVASIVGALAQIHERYKTLFDGAAVIEDGVNESISESATDRILLELSRDSGESLKHLVTVLSWIRRDAVPAPLARQLGSAGARHEVVEALVRFGGPAVTLLIGQLTSEDVDVKRAAVVALGRMGDARATPALTALLLDEDERPLWASVAGALARIGDRSPFEALLSRLGDHDAAVRQAAIGALNSIGDPSMSTRVSGLIDDPSPLVRESAVRIAGYFGYPDCVDAVFARCHDTDDSVRSAALELLPYFDDPRALDTLTAALSDPVPRVRAAAAHALGSMRGATERDLLMRALDDPEPWVRYFAAIGLGRQGDATALPLLARHARTDAAVHVGVAAINAAASIGGEAAVPVLAALALEDGERGQTAIRALGTTRSDAVVGVLREALRSEDPRRRTVVVEAFTAQGGAAAVEALAWTSTADGDPLVTRAAISGLRDIANRNVPTSGAAIRSLIEVLHDPQRRTDTLTELARLAPAGIPLLVDGLNAEDPEVRRNIVEALGRLRNPLASAGLRQALSDADAGVRRAAVTGLSRVGARGLGSRLSALALSDPSPAVQRAAAAALHRRGADTATGNE